MSGLYIPQFYPATWQSEYSIYGLDFTEDVCLGFVTQDNGSYSYLMMDDIKPNNIDTDKLLNNALKVLSEMKNNVQLKVARPEGSTVIWLQADNNFIAARLLLPKVQEFINNEIGNAFLFTIPGRDLVLVWNENAPEEITEKHKKEALEDFKESAYSLSPNIFRYSNKWPCRTFR